MKEMKRISTGKSDIEDISDEVDGAYGFEEVIEKFREVYEDFFRNRTVTKKWKN